MWLHFGTQDNQYLSIPIARVMQIQDILNGIKVWEVIRLIKESEQVIKAKVMFSIGEAEILLTNLYDEELFTNEDLKYLFGLRWRIETTYGKQKSQQQME